MLRDPFPKISCKDENMACRATHGHNPDQLVLMAKPTGLPCKGLVVTLTTVPADSVTRSKIR